MEASNGETCTLPNEMWLEIFSYLPYRDLQSVELVCKDWYKLTQTANLMNKSKLIVKPNNWPLICNNLVNDGEFSKLICHRTINIDSIKFDHSDLNMLKHLGQNVRNLVIGNCQILVKWHKLLFPRLQNLDIDGQSLHYDQFKNMTSSNLKNLHVELWNYVSAYNAFDLVQNASQTLNELNMFVKYKTPITRVLKRRRETFRSIQNLQTLKIYGYITCRGLKIILSMLSSKTNHLKHITLSGFEIQLDDDLLEIILEKWSSTLQEINLENCLNLSDDSIRKLNLVKNSLTHLNISGCTGVTGEGILQGIAESTNTVLRTLNLQFIENINDDVIGLLCKRLPRLTALYLDRKVITDKSLKRISKCLSYLEVLQIDNCAFDAYSESQIMSLKHLKCPTLRVLHMSCIASITNNDIQKLVRHCPGLEELFICGCFNINDQAIFVIATGLKQLRSLQISCSTRLTDSSLDYIATYCKNLQILRCNFVTSWNLEAIKRKLLRYKPDLLIYF